MTFTTFIFKNISVTIQNFSIEQMRTQVTTLHIFDSFYIFNINFLRICLPYSLLAHASVAALKTMIVSVTDLFTQRGPNPESIRRPVEGFSQRVASSPPFFCRCSVSVRVYATPLFSSKRDSHTGDTERTLCRQCGSEAVSVNLKNKNE